MYLQCRSLRIIHNYMLLKLERKREGEIKQVGKKYGQGRIEKESS